MKGKWSIEDIGSQLGKRFLITGGTSGIGLEAAKALVAAGGEVIIAADDEIKGQRVIRDLRHLYPRSHLRFERLDISDLQDIKRFCRDFKAKYLKLDVLINNAGLDMIPHRLSSRDGHELIFATNYLGHFALTGRLLPMLRESTEGRIVSVSSLEHREARIDFGDIEELIDYDPRRAYRQSKLALLMFALDLSCSLEGAGINVKSIPVHPGLSKTHIFDRGPSLANQYYHPRPTLWRFMMKLGGQAPEKGALPLLYAATSPDARSGTYYGPDGIGELRGHPTEARVDMRALNLSVSKKLWKFSEDVTGVRFPFGESERAQPEVLHH